MIYLFFILLAIDITFIYSISNLVTFSNESNSIYLFFQSASAENEALYCRLSGVLKALSPIKR